MTPQPGLSVFLWWAYKPHKHATIRTVTAVTITEVKRIARHLSTVQEALNSSSLLGSSAVQSALYGKTVVSRQIIE